MEHKEKSNNADDHEKKSISTNTTNIKGFFLQLWPVKPILLPSSDIPILSVSILNLPLEILIFLFSHLNTAEDLCSLSLVCKTFNQVADDDTLWKPLCNSSWIPSSSSGYKSLYMNWLRQTISKSTAQNLHSTVTEEGTKLIRLKILVLGNSCAGVSSFVTRFTRDEFSPIYKASIGTDFQYKVTNVGSYNCKVTVWEIKGSSRFRTLTLGMLRGMHGIMILFDLTTPQLFEGLEYWLDEINQGNDLTNVPIFFVGSKSDLIDLQTLNIHEAHTKAQERNASFMISSAKTGDNVESIFHTMIKNILFGTSLPRYIPSEQTLAKMGIQRKISFEGTKTKPAPSSCLCQ